MPVPIIIAPEAKSFIPYPIDTDFPVQNLPLGIFSTPHLSPRPCSIIGDKIIHLFELAKDGHLDIHFGKLDCLQHRQLNGVFEFGKSFVRAIRSQLAELFDIKNQDKQESLSKYLIPLEEVQLHLPIRVGDYTDFYSSREHATNVGMMFRDPAHALFPNWLHLPVAYHGRSSSIVVSGTHIQRPYGQIIPGKEEIPITAPSRQLDFELEMAFVIGKDTQMGQSIPIDQAESYIQGLALFNDWSARDIQRWEYVPLGPFLAKNFASTLAPWIVDLDALQAFKVEGPETSVPQQSYLQQTGKNNYDIQLEVRLNGDLICTSNTRYLYWSMAQQLAHHTINGCNIRVADLCASGTISGPDPGSYGSMLELCWKGSKPLRLSNGSLRSFLEDGDELEMTAFAQADAYRIGFGSAKGTISPAQR
ncbi:MAG TPA: fumarylacetoacetase [Saprospiraceae bacterium]|nr:fumarylacetoacetase [Saprospiraceae bacterium]